MANTFSADEAKTLRAKGAALTAPTAPATPAPATPVPAPAADSAPAAEATPPEDSGAVDSAADTTPADTAPADSAPAEGDTQPTTDDAADTTDAPKAGGARARIQELVEERNALRAYGKHLEGALERSRQAPAQPAAVAATPEPALDKAPTLESVGFDTGKYERALADFARGVARREATAAVAEHTTRANAESARVAFETRVEAFRKVKPDFDVKSSNPSIPPLHQRAAAMIVHDDSGPAIAYHLFSNPDIAVRIARQQPDAQVFALGQIKSQLAAAPAKPQQKIVKLTSAPRPPSPVPGGSSPGVDPNAPSASMKDFVAAHQAKVRERRRMPKR